MVHALVDRVLRGEPMHQLVARAADRHCKPASYGHGNDLQVPRANVLVGLLPH